MGRGEEKFLKKFFFPAKQFSDGSFFIA